MKKTVSILIAALACFSLFGVGQSEKDSMAGTIEVTAPGELPIVKQQLTMTAFAPSIGFVADWSTNTQAVWTEDKTNIHIEWQESSKVDAQDKLSIMFAGGEYPEIIFGGGEAGLSSLDIYKYGKQGIFIPLNDLIDKYGYWIKEMMKAEPYVKGAITSPDGKIYGLPAVYTDDYHMLMRDKLWINKVWLDNLGLKMPTTIDEFYTVMKAFKEKDANGNGDPNDEIPMTGAKRDKEDLAMWIMNAFVVAGGSDFGGDQTVNGYEYIVNGKVFFNASKPEFRKGLRFIHKCYEEGLIDVAALSQDKDQVKPLIDGGDASRIGAFASHHPGNMADLSDMENGRFTQYVALPPLKGPNSEQNTPYFIDTVVRPGEFMITDKCKDPAAAFRWADFMYSLEYCLQGKGPENVYWKRLNADSGYVGLNGKPAKYEYIKYTSMEENDNYIFGPAWTRDLKNEFAVGAGNQYEELLFRATEKYDPYKVRKYPYGVAAYKEEDVAEFNDLRMTIHTYIGESIDRFIIGDLSLDSDWDAYVKQLDQIGLKRYLEILKDAYKD